MKKQLSLKEIKSCPVEYVLNINDTLNVISGKWKLPILGSILFGKKRFTDIQRNIPKISPRMLSKELKELELNGMLMNQYRAEPFFLSNQAVINFKLKDFYSAISNAIKFTSFKDEFEYKTNNSVKNNMNSLNKINLSNIYRLMAESYRELENFKLAEQSYFNAIENSIRINDWCQYSKDLIIHYNEREEYSKLCSFVKYLEKSEKYSRCNLNKLVAEIKTLCELL